MESRKCILAVLLILSCFVRQAVAADPITARELLTQTILKEQVPDLRKGEIVVISHREGELDTELAVMLAMLLPANHKRVADVFQEQTGSDQMEGLLASIEITGADSQDFLEKSQSVVQYSEGEKDEQERLKKLSLNGDFNLSGDEYLVAEKALKEISTGKDEGRQLAAIMANILQGRYLAYSKGGLTALKPYRISKNKEANPSAELINATEFLKRIREGHPAYYQCLHDYPECSNDNITNQFFLVKQEEEGRPLFALKHLFVVVNDDYGLITERQFYLSHSLNSLQVVIGLLPFEDKTLVVLLNQVFTEKVNVPVGRRIAKKVGRSITVGKVMPLFENLQAAF